MAEPEGWQQFIDDLRDGKPDAVQLFLKWYAPDIERVVKKRWPSSLTRRADPEDLVQSIFRTFFRHLQAGEFQFGDGQALFALLYGIARRKVAKKMRHNLAGCRDPRKETSRAVSPDGEDGSPPGAIDRELSPLEALVEAETVEEFRKAVEDLETGQREVVEQILQGRSATEIGDSLGITDSMVRKRLRRARGNLRRRLREE